MEDEVFGKTLRRMREDAGRTVPETSEYLTSLGYKAKTVTVYGWERGVSQPNPEIFLEMCKFYGVSDIFSYFEHEPLQDDGALSEDERAHIKKYRLLDPYGKEAVDGVLDVEWRRCTQPLHEASQEPDKVVYITKWFPMPMSAGTGQPAGSEEPEELELTKRPPRGTSFVAPVSGDSMEPTYHNGDKLFIRECEEIEPGQIGVFYMDGQQWVKELGNGVLLSHNPAYPPRPMTEDVRCQGLVLGVCDDSYFE